MSQTPRSTANSSAVAATTLDPVSKFGVSKFGVSKFGGKVTIRAVSPDNGRELRAVVALLAESYGTDFPLQSLYQEAYWRAHVGLKTLNLLAYLDNEPVAHLALRDDGPSQIHRRPPVRGAGVSSGSRNTIFSQVRAGRMTHLACSVKAAHQLPEIAEGFREILLRVANRKGWRCITSVLISPNRLVEHVSSLILGGEVVAVLPNYVRGAHEQFALVVNQSWLRAHAHEPKRLYVPDEHRELCEYLYEPLGRCRVFDRHTPVFVAGQGVAPRLLGSPLGDGSASRRGSRAPAVQGSVTRGSPIIPVLDSAPGYYGSGVIFRSFANAGTTELFIEPSQVSIDTLATQVAKVRARGTRGTPHAQALFAYINLEDPSCEEKVQALTSVGFRCSGVLPSDDGPDRIVLFDDSRNGARGAAVAGSRGLHALAPEEIFASKRARLLARYTVNQNFRKASHALREATLAELLELRSENGASRPATAERSPTLSNGAQYGTTTNSPADEPPSSASPYVGATPVGRRTRAEELSAA